MDTLKQNITQLISQPQVASFATIDEKGNPWVRFVVLFPADEELNLFFTTHLCSRKVAQIKANPNVHIVLGGTDLSAPTPYMQIAGIAEVLTDRDILDAFWDDRFLQYYSGPNDPSFCIIKTTPKRFEYVAGPTPEILEM